MILTYLIKFLYQLLNIQLILIYLKANDPKDFMLQTNLKKLHLQNLKEMPFFLNQGQLYIFPLKHHQTFLFFTTIN